MQSVPITTDVVSSNLDQGEVHNIMLSWTVVLKKAAGKRDQMTRYFCYIYKRLKK